MKVQSGISNLFEETFNLMPGLVVLTDARLKIIRANQALLQVLDREPSQVIGQDLLKCLNIGEAEDEHIRQYLSAHLSSTEPIRFEAFIRMDSESGIATIVDTRFFPYQDQIVGLMVINDITEQKINEENLKIANQKIHRFLDEANDLIHSVSPDGSILFANQKWLSTLGYTQVELPALNIADIIREDRVPHCFNLMERVKHHEKLEFVETVFKTKDNREVYVEGNVDGQFEYGKFIATRGIFRDITSRKTVEETYSRLVKNFPQPIYIIHKGLFKYINPSFIKLTGYSENELLDKPSFRLVHPEDIAFVYKNAVRLLKANRSSSYDFRILTKSGEVRWVMETLISIPYEGCQAAMGTAVDFTERKMVENALEEAKNRYQALFNSASDAIYLHDMERRIVEVNDAACRLLGYSRAELLKISMDKIVSPRFSSTIIQNAPDNQVADSTILESENITKSGKLIPMEINSSIVEYENKKVAMVVSRDITERKQVENIRKRNEARLESLVRISEINSGSRQALLDFALSEIVKFTDSQFGCLYNYDETKKEFTTAAWSPELNILCGSRPQKQTFSSDQAGLLAENIKQRQPVIFNLSQSPSPLVNGYPEGHYQLTRTLFVPIVSAREVVWVVGVANKAADYDVNDTQQMVLFMDSVRNKIDRWKAEEAMRDSEYRYRQLIELSKDAIIIINQEGKAVMTNPAAREIFGYSENEFSGFSLATTYLPEERQIAAERLRQVISGHNLRFERQAIAKDAHLFPLEVSMSPLSHGLYQVVFRDITQRKIMEQEIKSSEQKYRLLVENQSDLVVEINNRGEFLFVNPAFIKLLGIGKDALIGSPMLALVHADDRQNSRRTFVDAVFNYECRLQALQGWRWVAWTENPVFDEQGNLTALTCIGRDITESREAREELIRVNKQLRELDKLKDNFLSTVSHELRTPLNSIKSFAEILLDYEEDRPTQKEFLGIINQESDRLTRLINDVLDLSKIQAGRMQWKNEEIFVADAIVSVINSVRPLLDKAQLQLTIEIARELPPVISDQDRLVQVITNLLGNAIKFTSEGGRITVKAWSEHAQVIVGIKDSGIGIASENFQKIFETFGQVGDVLKDRPKGTGLGLPISKKIIENYKGKIWVESVLGQGSTFLFSLPAVAEKTGVCKPGSLF